jgi:hypothetical protein
LRAIKAEPQECAGNPDLGRNPINWEKDHAACVSSPIVDGRRTLQTPITVQIAAKQKFTKLILPDTALPIYVLIAIIKKELRLSVAGQCGIDAGARLRALAVNRSTLSRALLCMADLVPKDEY